MTLPYRRSARALALCLGLGACAVAPDPVTPEAVEMRVAADWADIRAAMPVIEGSLSLYEAMALALHHNLSQRQKLMESALAAGITNIASYDMLPSVSASAGWRVRSNTYATVAPGGTASSTVEENRVEAGLTVAWNVLDFGVSYLRAHQEADRYLILEEQRRKAAQVLVRDVQAAWLRAVVAERLAGELEPLIAQVEAALGNARVIEERRLQAPSIALDAQRQMLDVLSRLYGLRQEVLDARKQLANLLGLPPDAPFTLDMPDALDGEAALDADAAALVARALRDRPELREEDYQARIAATQSDITLLELFPGLKLSGGVNYDSNKFLLNNTWADTGLSLVWSLLNLVSAPARLDVAEQREEAARLRRLALHLAVAMQVHVARDRLDMARDSFALAEQILEVDERLHRHARAAAESSVQTEIELIRRAANRLVSRTRRDLAYVTMEDALSALRISVGDDPLHQFDPAEDGDLVAALKRWHERGHRSAAPDDEPAAVVQWTVDAPEAPETPPSPLEPSATLAARGVDPGSRMAVAAGVRTLPAAPLRMQPAAPVRMLPAAPVVVKEGEDNGDAVIQLGAYRLRQSAEAEWRRLVARYPMLAGREPDISARPTPEGALLVRLRVSGSAGDLREVCETLKADGSECVVATEGPARLQVGMYGERGSAGQHWLTLVESYPDLAGFTPVVRRASIGDGRTLFSQQIEGARQDLAVICRTMREGGDECFVRGPS